MQVVFVIVMLNSKIDNHKSPVFSVSGKFFAWELFLVTIIIYLYVFQINHKPSVPQMGATKRNNFGQRHGLIRIQVCQVPCKRGLMFFFKKFAIFKTIFSNA